MVNFMAEEFDYYRIYKKGEDFIPLISIGKDGTSDSFYAKEKVENPPVINFYLQKPVPPKIPPVDLMTCPHLIFSNKLATLLNSLTISGIQLIPGQFRANEKPYLGMETEYYGLSVYHKIKCLNRELCDATIGTGIRNVKKLVLDKNILKEIPLEERLIFKLKEDGTYKMFHKSIVDKIMEVNPRNVRFVHIEDITNSTIFGR